jgi:DNA adenine methylase
MLSPLRYPGSKSDFIKTAAKIIKNSQLTGLNMIEPYAGSAAVSLGLLDLNLINKVTLVERDPLVYSFWKSIVDNSEGLISSFEELPITLDTWHDLRPLLHIDFPKEDEILKLGIAGLFFNRANFSGILNAGPIGGKEQKSAYKIDCRTNKIEIANRIRKIANYKDRISVVFGDAVNLITDYKETENVFFYIDPPYFQKGESLYRYFYRLKEHKTLANALSNVKFKWLLSYDYHHVIEFLYEEFYINKYEFQYSARSPKNHTELLISNFLISPESLIST